MPGMPAGAIETATFARCTDHFCFRAISKALGNARMPLDVHHNTTPLSADRRILTIRLSE
jgi:hypothetical protein